ncbi:ABC transporter permease [Tessaracoccus sp.]
MDFPRIPIGEWVASGIDWLTINAGFFFDFLSTIMKFLVEGLSGVLIAVPWFVMALVLAALGWLLRSARFAGLSLVGFLLIVGMNQWDNAMLTLSMVLIATLLAVVVAIPLGIAAAQSDSVSAALKPILDFMQTMPAFVYLIPAVTFFSIGVVPGLFSTIIFALPPGVRMTELGIRGVAEETVEAGQAFGAKRSEILFGIQLPLAVPTIMAGINQVIMLALSMAVIAGIVGADGLGKEVVSSIATLNLAKGVEAGLSVVFLAIFLDRFTGALGDRKARSKSSLLALVKKARAAEPAIAA